MASETADQADAPDDNPQQPEVAFPRWLLDPAREPACRPGVNGVDVAEAAEQMPTADAQLPNRSCTPELIELAKSSLAEIQLLVQRWETAKHDIDAIDAGTFPARRQIMAGIRDYLVDELDRHERDLSVALIGPGVRIQSIWKRFDSLPRE